MSDEIYVQQQRARQRRMIIILIPIVMIACLVFAVYRIYWDECTGGWARDPISVTESYMTALQQGNLDAVRRCWIQQEYFELENGCSEICATRWAGTEIDGWNIQLEAEEIVDNRLRLPVTVSVGCPDGSTESGQIILDATPSDVPWRHFKIVYSEAGGQVGDPWCE